MATVTLLALSASVCATAANADSFSGKRASCTFKKGDKVETTLGIASKERKAIPIKHVIVVMQENRSFDHYFGKLSSSGQINAQGWLDTFANTDKSGVRVTPHHLTSTCLEKSPSHQWDGMRAGWNNGRMDGFITNAATGTSDGHYALGYYDATNIPFYYWLANTYALGDHYFSSIMSGTWSNRNFLYTGTSGGVKKTGERTLKGVPTIFEKLFWKFVSWQVYTDGTPRQDSLGWKKAHLGVSKTDKFFDQLKSGKLPRVSFVDPAGSQDEHPPHDIQGGEAFMRKIYQAVVASPLWPSTALIFTYDEGGGLFDHVAPPKGCAATAEETGDWQQLGVRVPFIVVSPYAKRHFVSHTNREHTSILRFIELLHNVPALSARDANADALLEFFDFTKPQPNAGDPPASGTAGCPTVTNDDRPGEGD